ncbi:F-type H+-transporting ATPase subunit a [Dysgonomonas sp. PFB1-18]|uniref:F0F1 ATP synthase subunit A n=1 Tax=unclassified Dysgonomonas TaxID=2630389 RepID=UPI002473F23A|nr:MULTISPECIES: F0F1 ATP synthase subunit A [unclassified Dysgonomonas]MDH6308530.1 F-type H+-transporting ATPase subunit a [Dysgonomonas sp. PF1-14]MDH6338031.1 F-type H+-transporting ATPase subunit a [Dysgonomonas sp. PF1-16]MDH6379528.1 F-type H+-transporting ATPase subunit a [Dysgonomonas sp. PFB1-18]MDH6396858.1 F-type H+-transporting ATPase subunit a [Dysgonomonas sp. PF1-23]
MKHYLKYILASFFMLAAIGVQPVAAAGEHGEEGGELNVKELILDHLADSYEWHLTTWGDTHVSIPLPVIVKGETSGWHVFMSSQFHHGHEAYNGFYIARSGDYKGKIVEKNAAGEEVRPLDFSLTKNATSLIISSILLLIIVMSVAGWYKKMAKSGEHKAPKGFVGFMEMFIMSVQDDIIKPCVGKNFRKFSPYLLTVFFFIFFNNILGLIPIFPGGANVTGNIAVTLVLALFTFFIVNMFGSKEYWKEIFWPDVPTWLKVPIPIMPAIELVGVFTKPFALMIRLFANILAGHSIVLGLTCLIFVTVNLGPVINGSMTLVSVLLTVFISFVEILVAYIQAYVFTMLSAVFIGLAQVEPHHHAEKH